MIKIAIDQDIGMWGIHADDISAQLQHIADGEEIEITINSPGGSIFSGIAIFNIIREYAKTHPVAVIINGLAASVATYIAIAARTVNPASKISISDNSIWVIHNPYCIIEGDYRKFQKQADYLQRLTSMFVATYAAVSKQDQKTIADDMNAETFYIGKEIFDFGFANNYVKINPDEETDPQNMRDALIVNARAALQNVMAKVAENEPPVDEKAVALLENTLMGGEGRGAGSRENNPEAAGTLPPADSNNLTKPDGGEPPAGKGGSMNEEELKAKYPEVYAAIFGDGKKAGIKEERERTAAHLKLGEKCGSLETAAKYIRDGSSVTSEDVQSEYLSLRIGRQAVNNRNADDPGSVTTGGEESEDDTKAMAIFEAAYAGKEFKGGKK